MRRCRLTAPTGPPPGLIAEINDVIGDEDRVEITITDNGRGISQENIEKIFVPFFTTKEKGSGLGLSISKGIIEDHAGSSFTLESKVGQGTAIKITLPVYREDEIPSTK